MNNQINGISPSNKNLGMYMEAGRGVAGYLEIVGEIGYGSMGAWIVSRRCCARCA